MHKVLLACSAAQTATHAHTQPPRQTAAPAKAAAAATTTIAPLTLTLTLTSVLPGQQVVRQPCLQLGLHTALIVPQALQVRHQAAVGGTVVGVVLFGHHTCLHMTHTPTTRQQDKHTPSATALALAQTRPHESQADKCPVELTIAACGPPLAAAGTQTLDGYGTAA